MSFFQRHDGDIHYEVTGEGPPLALVSGLGGAGGYWNNIVPMLARHFTVVLHDHMGTGKSVSRRTRHSVDALAEDIDALMTHLGHARYSLVGHSTGAAVGQVLAADRPRRIDRLVLFAGWAGPDRHFELCFAVRKTALERVGVVAYNEATPIFLYPPLWISRNPDALASIIKLFNDTSPPADVMAARIDMIVAFDRRGTTPSITAPTLVICARDDILTPPHLSEELAALIPDAQLKLLDYGAHACSQVVADEFLASVLPFLRA
jgi:aminoacrylate hydrolase